MVGFDHRDPGTPEEVWSAELGRRVLPPIGLLPDDLLVVAAHPDDETLGAAGLVQRAARSGARVTVVVATDGEASHPSSSGHPPAVLARTRREEVRHAVSLLDPRAHLVFLGLPDGGLREHRAELLTALDAVVDDPAPSAGPGGRPLVVAPWSGDGHRDHRIAAEVVAELAAARGLRHLGYPIWLWHWGSEADPPWERAVALSLTGEETDAKVRAIAAHVSQTEPLSAAPGDEEIVHRGMRAHFERAVEVFLEEEPDRSHATLGPEWFDAFYRRNGDDPWGFETRWYEERKRAVVLASLPSRRLGDVLEIGCATGLLTRELADRADRVLAMEAASSAARSADDRLAALAHVEVVRAAVPDDWPAGTFDTVVLSEVGYYLSPVDLQRTIALVAGALADEGCLVACHWRHPVAEYPQTGDQVHESLRAHPGWRVLVRHDEPDFVLEVFAAVSTASVAEREGLTT